MVKFSNIISESFQLTKNILITPFSFKKWIILGFIAWLAGTIGGGGNINLNGLDSFKPTKEKVGQQSENEIKNSETGSGIKNESNERQQPCPYVKKDHHDYPYPPIFILLILAILFIILIITVFLLQPRFSFIFLENVIQNDASIKAPFRRYRKIGNSLLLFHVSYLIIFLIIMGLLLAPLLASLIAGKNPIEHPWTNIVIPLCIFLLVVLPVSILSSVFESDVLVPVMMKDDVKVIPGWQKVFSIVLKNKQNFVLYVLLKIGLGICAGILCFIAYLILLIALFIAGGLLALIFYGIGKLLPAIVQSPCIGIIIALFIVILIVVIFAGIIITGLPAAVFFRILSIKFLAAIDTTYTLLPVPVAVTEKESGPSENCQ